MWKNIPITEFQRDVDDGWKNFCDDKIKHLRRLSLSVQSQHSKDFLESKINIYKKMRGRKR